MIGILEDFPFGFIPLIFIVQNYSIDFIYAMIWLYGLKSFMGH